MTSHMETPSTDCLLIDDWGDLDGKQTANRRAIRTLTEGTYTLQVDYYDFNDRRDAILKLNVSITSNEG